MKISLYPPLSIYEIGQRDNQEDAIWPLQPTSNDKLFILCDGMGGHEHGEVASQTVSQAIGEWFETKAIEPLTKSQIEDALAYAYAKLDEKDEGEFRKMGTTLTLLYIGGTGILAAHMGDSRIYHIRPGNGVLYQSRDHSLVFDLFQSGEITYNEMNSFSQKNIVTRAMTPGEDNRMHSDIIQITDVQAGDFFYLCSDGMLEQMSNTELVALFSSEKKDEEKRQQLILDTANSQDNHSAWLIHINDVISEEGDKELVNEEPTARCNAINILPQSVPDDDVVIVKEAPKKQSFLTWLKRLIRLTKGKK
jgi:protein phosphatase